jgi:hypothetical protein
LAFAYLLLFLLPIAAIAYIIWDHRRKLASREAARAGRIEELIAVSANPTTADDAAAPVSDVQVPTSTPAPTASIGASVPAAYVLRERLLSPPQTLLYYLLRTGLPDCLVFAQTPVASVLEPGSGLAAYAREEQARIFARHVVDFVIADRSTRPIAVVKLTASADTAQGSLSLMRTWFAAVGVRYVELDPAALPRKEAVRAVVLGDADAHENGASSTAAAP